MKPEVIYWDSCAFLGWLQEEPENVELCRGTLERAQAGEVGIVTSALTLTEVLWTKGGPRLAQDKSDVLRKFFRHSYIRVFNLTRGIAERAQDVVWSHGIKPKDAIHVATALGLGSTIFETFDRGLLDRDGRFRDESLVFRKPIPPKERSLF